MNIASFYLKTFQDAILPSEDHINQLLKDRFIFYLPKDIVAGGFYRIEKVVEKGREETLYLP